MQSQACCFPTSTVSAGSYKIQIKLAPVWVQEAVCFSLLVPLRMLSPLEPSWMLAWKLNYHFGISYLISRFTSYLTSSVITHIYLAPVIILLTLFLLCSPQSSWEAGSVSPRSSLILSCPPIPQPIFMFTLHYTLFLLVSHCPPLYPQTSSFLSH